jgi:hypothetical protein
MLHWARSFATIALGAGFVGLGALAPAFGGAAMLVAGLFAALAALAVLTGVLGRRGDGTYSAERALVLASVAVALVLTGRTLIGDGWTMSEAQRFANDSLAAITRTLL